MAWFKKKPDPINDRARQLSDEIARLEAHIQELGTRLEQNPGPRWKSTAVPQSAAREEPPPPSHDPIFEPIRPISAKGHYESTPNHYNELGVRKYDLPALINRLKNHLRGPSTTNPKLVSYLAAGGIQGLRPLRYEKRIARNRMIVLVIILFFMLLGIILVYVKH